MLLDSQEFSQITSRMGQRLGANSPHDATAIVDNLVATSQLTEEIDAASRAIDFARERIDFATASHEARGKRILEIFGLIFAAAGLGCVL